MTTITGWPTWSGQVVTHDDDGNMTRGPLPSGVLADYVFDARNHLKSAGGESYSYDAEGNRVSLTNAAGTTRFVIDPNGGPMSRVLVRERPDTTKVLHVYAGSLLLYEVEAATDAPRYFHSDQVGNSVALSNAAGAITDRITYTPFGSIASRTGTSDTPFLFGGALGCATSSNGLVHMRARYYQPKLGRFVNQDPIGFGGGGNWYAFANGNPIMFGDPSGYVAYGDLGRASIGLVGNGFGMLAAAALAVAPDPTLATKVGAVVLAGKSSYGLGVNAQNFVAAIRDQSPVSTGALTNDVAQIIAPGSQIAQNIATGLDIGSDLSAAGVSIAHGLSRIPAGQRSLSTLMYYEIGQKTMSDDAFKVWGAIDDPVMRGMSMVDKVGWARAIWPSARGASLGIGTTFGTGPTPLSQAAASSLGGLGGVANQVYNVKDQISNGGK